MNAARTLSLHMLELPFHEQIAVMKAMCYDFSIKDYSDNELCRLIFKQAAAENRIAKLWTEVESRHPKGESIPNPYETRKAI